MNGTDSDTGKSEKVKRNVCYGLRVKQMASISRDMFGARQKTGRSGWLCSFRMSGPCRAATERPQLGQ